jgi:hypothetical protein
VLYTCTVLVIQSMIHFLKSWECICDCLLKNIETWLNLFPTSFISTNWLYFELCWTEFFFFQILNIFSLQRWKFSGFTLNSGFLAWQIGRFWGIYVFLFPFTIKFSYTCSLSCNTTEAIDPRTWCKGNFLPSFPHFFSRLLGVLAKQLNISVIVGIII